MSSALAEPGLTQLELLVPASETNLDFDILASRTVAMAYWAFLYQL